jgi:eukaryotic-like serine/threonine-protein kinase
LRHIFGAGAVATLHAMNVRSRILQDSKRLPEAIALQRETLVGRITLLGAWHDDVAYSHVNLGGMLMQQADYQGAIHEYQQALQIRQRLLTPDHVDVITNLVLLADTQRLLGNLAMAQSYALDAVTRGRRGLALDRPELGAALFRYAQILHAQQRNKEAHAAAEEALAVYAHTLAGDHPRMRALRELLARLGSYP